MTSWVSRLFDGGNWIKDLEQRCALAESAREAVMKQLHEAQAGALRAEQEVIHLRALVGDLREDVKVSQTEALQAVKTLANSVWQTKYGVALYADAVQIPEARTLPSEPGGVLPGKTSVLLEKESRMKQFMHEAETQWEMAHGKR